MEYWIIDQISIKFLHDLGNIFEIKRSAESFPEPALQVRDCLFVETSSPESPASVHAFENPAA